MRASSLKAAVQGTSLILAIFDLDDTLTLQDTESLWQEYLVSKKLIDKALFIEKKQAFEKAYHEGILQFDDVISFSMGPIAKLSYQEQKELQEDFAKNHLKSIILPQAQALVRSHYERDHHILILSAGHEFLIEPASQYFQAHHVLCSQLVRGPCGKYHPYLRQPPLYRERKVQALLGWLHQNSYSPITTYFYSDSINDLPLLNYVQIPIAVSPCPALKKEAVLRGWPILDLKKEFFSQQSLRSI